VVTEKGVKKLKPLPKTAVTNWAGLDKFLHIALTDAAGKKVYDQDQTFCPNSWETARTTPDAPARSPYPDACNDHPFTLGAVWGIQAGWSANTASQSGVGGPGTPQQFDVPDGAYTATVSVNKPGMAAFGIPADKATASVKVSVKTEVPPPGKGGAAAAAARKKGLAGPAGTLLKPAAKPAAVTTKIPAGPKPDLRAVPALGIEINDGSEGKASGSGQPVAKADEPKTQYLAFSANVWNGGDSPLVVDGFRTPGADVMDAYQYFFDAKGKQVGSMKTGTMEYDAREGHQHWHFRDFARYSLLSADKKEVVRSQKEAFCLAATDAIDLTLKSVNFRPTNTNLHTACGSETALSIREALDIGWGDTYAQFRPGQSFDITGLQNGTYYIQVVANPEKHLIESNLNNNTSLRKVVLGGEPGSRTVTVPPYELIDAP
jgi:hypothetical protein